MSDETMINAAPAEDVPAGEVDEATAAQAPETDEEVDGAEALRDEGKRALDRMKAERNEWKAKAREAEKRVAELMERVEALENGGRVDEAAKAAREAEAAAIAKANERILKAEIKAAAAGKLADPSDALRFLDLSDFEVSPEGDVDAEAIAEAIDGLVKSKPYLSAATVRRFQGSADGGARKGPQEPSQLTREDLKRMTPEEINKARIEGRLNDLLNKR